MIFRDFLLELRAIRHGIEYLIALRSGKHLDLVADVEMLDRLPIKRGAPRQPSDIIHRNSDHLLHKQRLREVGDDTDKMIEQVRTAFGDRKADQLREFYEKEVLGKR